MKNFAIVMLVAVLSYILGSSHNTTQTNENSRYIAIATRMIFTQQCSEVMDEFFGKSSNSTMMSKEHIQMSNICYTIGDQISKEIEKTKEITEENIVEVVDKAIGKVKRDLASANEASDEENQDSEPLEEIPNQFI